jgi:hypothetical protein
MNTTTNTERRSYTIALTASMLKFIINDKNK